MFINLQETLPLCLIFIKDKPKCPRVMKDTENRLFRSKNTGLYSDALSIFIYLFIRARDRERERETKGFWESSTGFIGLQVWDYVYAL